MFFAQHPAVKQGVQRMASGEGCEPSGFVVFFGDW